MIAYTIVGASLLQLIVIQHGGSKAPQIYGSAELSRLRTHQGDHMMAILVQFHWLPIKARVTFKITTRILKIQQIRQI